ncbi:MAG: GvpL/GvpF family gas vesicle protein [candidate division Zixibacteria bacterium]|nr:GvpL/GvpF family gas vesicle protein [candidate division Zixibacteria bacterium]
MGKTKGKGVKETLDMLDDNKPGVIVTNQVKAESKEEGRYLYCIGDSGEKAHLGKIGLDDKEVYTIPYVNLCAVVHNCPSEPYKSEDNEVVKRWVVAHEKVVESAWEKFGTVLPLGFDTIIKGEKDISPDENIKNWLKQDYVNLKEKIDKIRGKAEYGVQVFWEPKLIADEITKTSEEIKSLNQDIKSKSKGMAYMLKPKLENLLKKEMEKKADLCFKDFYARIKKYVFEIRVEKTKIMGEKGKMLMNLSCLVDKEKSRELGEELEKINEEEGFAVRFTGPWPPYSFVAFG